jgi:predicted dehydrogenase
MSLLISPEAPPKNAKKIRQPRLGFLGVGWIGRNRMEAIAQSELAEISAIADASEKVLSQTAAAFPNAKKAASLEELLELDLDGIVIATPSALHAEQSIRALENGVAVFCQKPLARNFCETKQVIDVARKNDALLGVDLSYRHIHGVAEMRNLLLSGELGKIFAADLVFHNAYGPDKNWFYNRQLSGGGCVIDLGIHLVDLALWCLDFPVIRTVSSRLFSGGKPLDNHTSQVEDFALARLDAEKGIAIQLSCSWKLPAGCDAIIRASFYGTNGGVEFRNVNGSFYEFVAEHLSGTRRNALQSSQKNWGGCAAVEWTRQLAGGNQFNSSIERLENVAAVLDKIYGGSQK